MHKNHLFAFISCLLFFIFGCGLSTDASDSLMETEPTIESVQIAPSISIEESPTKRPTQPPKTESLPDFIGPVVTPTFYPAAFTDTSRQLETFDTFWQTVNDEYVYPDFNGVDWDGIDRKSVV